MTFQVKASESMPIGSGDLVFATINISSYASGGENVTPASLNSRLRFFVMVVASSVNLYIASWNKLTGKLQILATVNGVGNPLTEVIAGTNVGSVSLIAFGGSY